MNYRDEYRSRETCQLVAEAIRAASSRPVTLMEVCGGHTVAIHKYGIRSLLPSTVNLISGPGCPVCVTSRRFVDHAVALSRRSGVIVATFGDLIRVPGSSSSLELEKARGGDVRIVYSPLDALDLARQNPEKNVVFLGIGFETTAPTSAAAVAQAAREGLGNFLLLSSHKTMPEAMEALVTGGIAVDGFICPGHVSVITGSGIYRALAQTHGRACVISGFEPADVLLSILMLVKQIEEKRPSVEIEYARAVRPDGNRKALGLMREVFAPRDEWWRGLGVIACSGLGLSTAYAAFDAEKALDADVEETREPQGCICGQILKGVKSAAQCPLFEKVCTPMNPVGACMVSSEGSCAAYYRYGRTA